MMSEESTPVPIAAAAAKAVASSSSSSSNSADSSADSKTIPNISELLRSMTTKTTIETPTTTTTTISGEDNNGTTTTTTTTTTITDPILTIAPQQNSPPLVHCSHAPSSLSLPKTISRSYLIYKIPTHMFCQIYNDRIVLGITQLSKSKKGHIGSWVLCQSSKSEINPNNIDYELSTLLGNTTTTTTSNTAFDEKEIYSRRITERLLEKAIVVPRGIDKLTVLLGISLLPIIINPNPNPNNSKTKSSTSTSDNDDFTSTFTSMERFKIIVEVLVELIEETASL